MISDKVELIENFSLIKFVLNIFFKKFFMNQVVCLINSKQYMNFCILIFHREYKNILIKHKNLNIKSPFT